MTISLHDHLYGIYDRHGVLTPEIVVEEARDPDHPLHDRFEWNDGVAAESWRREQAHNLIKSVKLVYRKAEDGRPPRSLRAFQAIRTDRDDETVPAYVYEPVEKVVSDSLMTAIVMADMRRDWLVLRRRYEDFAEFWKMVQEDLVTLDVAA